MIKKHIYTGALLLMLLGLQPGCVPSKPVDEVEILAADRLVVKLEANRRKIKSFEGNGTISVESPQFSNSASFRVIVAKPDSVFLAINGPFGIELATALITKKNFQFYNAMGNTLYRGETNNDILREIFRVNISFTDLMDALVGSVNLTERLYKTPDDYHYNQNQYEISYNDAESESRISYIVDMRDLGIREFVINNRDGNELLKGIYSRFKLFEQVPVPEKIRVINKKDRQEITIEYDEMKVNQPGAGIQFSYPEDADIVDL
ncbi:MAG: DUF4292 domain-containing protein [Ignavibacteriaceae bacterium]|nr:DUF4292 domain-containing protein [Ignavibacteriaceae bacterium]